MRADGRGAGGTFFYGWIVLAIATFAMSLTVAGNGVGLAVFLDPILADLELSRSLASAFFTVASLVGAAALPLVGFLLDRWGARRTLVAVALGFAGACAFMARVDGVVTLAVGLLILRVLGLGALNLTGLHAVNQWFVARRGIAVGAAGVAIGLLMGAYPALLDVSVTRIGWRATYLVFAAVVAFVLAPVAALWMRSTPERVGLLPDGGRESVGEPAFAARRARRTRMLWTIVAADVLVAVFVGGLVFHHYDVAAGQGVDRATAGTMFLPFGAASALSILGVGVALRWVGPRTIMALMLGATVAALLLALRLDEPLLPLYGALVGLAQGSKDAVQANAYAHYFGRRELGAIAGTGAGFSLVGAAVGPTLFALARDPGGSYGGVILVGAVAAAAAALPVVTAPDPRA